MIRTLSLLLAGAACCTPSRLPRAADCFPPSKLFVLPDSEAITALAGEYEMTTVATVAGYDSTPYRSRLSLRPAPADSARVTHWQPNGVDAQWRPLIGRLEWMSQGQSYSDVVAVYRSSFTVGRAQDCEDCSPTYYSIVISPSGFTGRWVDYQTGNVFAVDARGRKLPNPEGYYCARRVSRSPRDT